MRGELVLLVLAIGIVWSIAVGAAGWVGGLCVFLFLTLVVLTGYVRYEVLKPRVGSEVEVQSVKPHDGRRGRVVEVSDDGEYSVRLHEVQDGDRTQPGETRSFREYQLLGLSRGRRRSGEDRRHSTERR